MADPLWINAEAGAPEYNASELRRNMSMIMYPYNESGSSGRFGNRQGVNPAGIDAITLSGSTITQNHIRAMVSPEITETQGSYYVQVPQQTFVLTAADPANDRLDNVIIRVWDDDEDSSGERKADVVYQTGTPSAIPTEPSIPVGAFRLATIDVPAEGTGAPSLTYNAPYTVALGGILPVRDETELPTGGRYIGMPVWRQDLEELHIRTAGEWTAIAGTPQSVTSFTPAILGSNATFSVAEGQYTYIAPKVVWVNMHFVVSSGGSGTTEIKVDGPTNISRVSRQSITGYIDNAPTPANRLASLILFLSDPGREWDRIRWMDLNNTVQNMIGGDLDPGMNLVFTGTYLEE